MHMTDHFPACMYMFSMSAVPAGTSRGHQMPLELELEAILSC